MDGDANGLHSMPVPEAEFGLECGSLTGWDLLSRYFGAGTTAGGFDFPDDECFVPGVLDDVWVGDCRMVFGIERAKVVDLFIDKEDRSGHKTIEICRQG
jgi:hypothetical protein